MIDQVIQHKSTLFIFCIALLVLGCTQNIAESETNVKPVEESYPRDLFQRSLRLPNYLSDRAVFQRNHPIVLSGVDVAGTDISITFNNQTLNTTSSPEGKWSVEFPSMEAGGPYTISISGSQNQILHDILIGDVFLLAGQSNIGWPVRASDDPADYAKDAADDSLRFFSMAKPGAAVPQSNVNGIWFSSQQDSFLKFSAIGFHMGRKLRESNSVPIGLIDVNMGGSRAEAWLPNEEFTKTLFLRSYYSSLPEMSEEVQRSYEDEYREFAGTFQEWLDLYLIPFDRQLGDWTEIDVPGYIESKVDWHHDGGSIFRHRFSIDPSATDDDYLLSLGVVDDYDQVYFNDVMVGKTHFSTPEPWTLPRYYRIPKELIREENEIIISVLDVNSAGGFAGPAEVMTLSNSDNPEMEPINLSGKWEVAKEFSLSIDIPPAPERPSLTTYVTPGPALLYNGAIHPFINMKFAGVLWYQGESNTDHYKSYAETLQLLITSWRSRLNQPDLPFYVFQLSAFGSKSQTFLSKWAEFRQAQFEITQNVPDSYLIPTVDFGDCDDVHPRQKEPVGLRVAEFVQAITYDQTSPPSIPRFKSYDLVSDAQALVVLDGVDRNILTKSDEDEITGFWTSDESRVFFPATAELTEDGIIISSSNGSAISAIRYLWTDCPEDFLIAENGYPLLPFRTDDWDDALTSLIEDEDED